MEAIVERCCGLDVHQATVVACLLVGQADEKPRKEVKTFATVTRELEALRDWLRSAGCTHVGMESTGVYWKPVYAILEGHFDLIVGNARYIKNVPGRKTDVKDAEWIADLVRHGLIRKSFVPAAPIRELRDLVRYRTKVVQSRTAERQRLLNLLETANVKLASIASDVFGVSGMLMVKGLLEGRMTAAEMAELARGKLRKKIPDLALALEGRMEEHHRLLLGLQIRRLEDIDGTLAELEQRIEQKLAPYRTEHALLSEIPGVDHVVAAVLIAELGVDMSVFPDPWHLSSWAGVCPGNHESAGKRRSGRTCKGNPHLRAVLVQAALAGAQTHGTYLRDKYYRLKARRGAKRAALAIAHKILVAAYHILSRHAHYRELGDAYLDQLSEKRVVNNLVRRLERLGYAVNIERTAA
jgi:transposase